MTFLVDYGNLFNMTPQELKRWRKGRTLTQSKMGDMLGVTKACISRWESGHRPIPYLLTLALKCLKVKKEVNIKTEGKKTKKKGR